MTLLASCSVTRSYSLATLARPSYAYTCAVYQLQEMRYTLELQDPVGGVVQARREITGFVETARRGAARATEVITLGVAGGSRTRYDELTVAVYKEQYPQGNTSQATAGMLTVAGEVQERSKPTDAAKTDARNLIDACAPRF